MQMRTVGMMLIACSLAGGAAAVQARELREGDKYMCSWGAGTAARAQELKLSGVSLYAARQKIQTIKFSKSWMRMMAMGITEQTYDSPSRLKPEVIRQSFYQDCLRYKVARK
ncbi:Valyl-tRNA synthetase [Pseudomonas antarctica]|jgi:glucan biosynthesis protein|uniref:Valyl-tRNA synthetase n=2 Tax=Pseudomonas TaxID=286 RepID=A0A172Z0F1_9PSED|nr:Valyl-tRNA synthetase [Pseudomonas antarctica]